MNAIEVHQLSKYYGTQPVVHALSMHVPKGSIFGFIGPNGSGKTTTIRMICGLVTPDAGHGSCLGYDILSQQSLIKQHIGYMPQKFSYYSELTVRENLEFVADVMDISNPKERIDQLIEEHRLAPYAQRPAGLLSGGWKQRVSLACALMHRPKLLLLDEPTASVDPGSRRDFWNSITEISHLGTTVLVSTHLMDETARCTHLAYLLYGNLIAHGTPDKLIAASHLRSIAITTTELNLRKQEIQERFKPKHLAMFGNALHITDSQHERLEEIQKYCTQNMIPCAPISVGIEDVFIHFMEEKKRDG